MSQCLSRATVLGAVAVTLVLLPAGCGGPTYRGLEARQAANDRFDRVNTQVVYDQARQALSTGQFDLALDHIDRAIERYPKDSTYLVLRGRILLEQRRLHQAKESLDRAIEVDAKNADAYYFLGVVAQRCDDHAAARVNYEKAYELDPKNLQFLACCAEMQLASGDPKGAREVIERSAPSFEYNPVLQQIRAACLSMEGRTAEAAHVMELAFARDSENSLLAEDLVNALFDAGEWAECMRALDLPILASVRDRPDLMRTRARCLIMLARPIEARDLLLMKSPAGEATVEHLVTLGYAAWAANDWTRLSACGEQLVTGHPKLAEGYLFLGALERERGNLQASERWLEQALARGESRDLVIKLRTRVQAQLAARGDVAEGG